MHDAAVGIANSFRAKMASIGAARWLDRRDLRSATPVEPSDFVKLQVMS
jgi:hypothetical protein